MDLQSFNILSSLYNASMGLPQNSADLALAGALKDKAVHEALEKKGLIDAGTGEITPAGVAVLEPFRVDNAVILAAGPATRFVPLSLEQPKGLYEVKGEKLIERQIQQLIEAGISDITVVLGYKKEKFEFLAEKYGVKFIFNPEYNMKNNIESLYRAREALKNTYVCVCDSYYPQNPFNQYEFRSFYTGYSTSEQQEEMYASIAPDRRITDIREGLPGGMLLMGHAFWTRDFSSAFTALAEENHETGRYDDLFWEWLVRDNLDRLPPFYFKEYRPGSIFEFDYFEQLRQFDTDYVGHAHSEILRNIKLVFRCEEEDIIDFRKINEGLTNTSFIFRIDGVDYIYRHPGDGTESIINRRNEKMSLIKAKEFGIDPTYIYMEVNEGWKISKFVSSFREPDYHSFEDSRRILEVLRHLHSIPVKVDYGMKPWEDALAMEKLLKEKEPHCFDAYERLKSQIGDLYRRTLDDGVEKCFCHGDTYKPNWMLKEDGQVILIDWEYAGFSDPGIDVGYYIVDAMYDFPEAERFIREYLQAAYTEEKAFHFMAYTAIIAYYWFVWAMYRESCGANMKGALENWRFMAEKYAKVLAL
ncbi:MAG: phosphotransferase [Firmicutes bacterium]|nr:phosphotransferase [Bacillota bacterium]